MNSRACPQLVRMRDKLLALSVNANEQSYAIPTLWTEPYATSGLSFVKNPAHYYAQRIESLLHAGAEAPAGTMVQRIERMYCLIPRHFSSFDHYSYSESPSHDSVQLWSKSGTFLKTIALLPYLQTLGITQLYLLPCIRVAELSRKGTLGSIYSQRTLNELDPQLSEEVLEMSLDDQFRALVEAAHFLGMKVIMECALRTTSRDAQWIAEHPDWYYWIDERATTNASSLHPPHFDDLTLDSIHRKIEAGDFSYLPRPDEMYRTMFCAPPQRVVKDASGEFIGIHADGSRCRVASAFADYPPNDTQPLWTDVSYLRLHTHPDFHYPAYNTVRMFDDALREQRWHNHALWETLESIIPGYIERFDIDGVVLDMCHALPSELKEAIQQRARALKPDLVFIEENFFVTAQSREAGFDAVLGDFWLQCDTLEHVRAYVDRRRIESAPIPFLACCDTHNSPRLFGRHDDDTAMSMLELSLSCPQGLPCLLSGTEFGNTQVFNTGLGFRPEELASYHPEDLALFSYAPLDWINARTDILARYRSLLSSAAKN